MTYVNTTKNELVKAYDELLFYPRSLQTRELNVLQGFLNNKISTILHGLYEEGTVITGRIEATEKKIIFNCSILLNGKIKEINKSLEKTPGEFILAKLKIKEVSMQEDSTLADPLQGSNYKNIGASRRQTTVEVKISDNGKQPGYTKIATIINNHHVEYKTAPSLNRTQDNIYDLVLNNLDFSGVKNGMRVLVKGDIFTVEKPIVIKASNVNIEFSPSTRVFGTDNGPISFFIFKGDNISLIGLHVGFLIKPDFLNKPDPEKIPDPHLFKGKKPAPFSRLTTYGQLEYTSSDGVVGRNIPWEVKS